MTPDTEKAIDRVVCRLIKLAMTVPDPVTKQGILDGLVELSHWIEGKSREEMQSHAEFAHNVEACLKNKQH